MYKIHIIFPQITHEIKYYKESQIQNRNPLLSLQSPSVCLPAAAYLSHSRSGWSSNTLYIT